jgi:hypothetical protein
MKKRDNYLSNEKFLEELKKYFEKKKENPDTPCPNSIARMFLLIANKFVNSFKSSTKYGYREDMVQNGVLFCLSYMDNFSLKESNNPFAYFTQVIKSAFYQTYNKEINKLKLKKSYEEYVSDRTCSVRIKHGMKLWKEDEEESIEEIIDRQMKEEKESNQKYIFWEKEVQELNSDFIENILPNFFKTDDPYGY